MLSARRYTSHLGDVPGLMFSPSCPKTFNSVRDLQFKPVTATAADNDPREVFLDRNKHGFDSLGYGLDGYVLPRGAEVVRRAVRPGVNLGAREAFTARDDPEEWVEAG